MSMNHEPYPCCQRSSEAIKSHTATSSMSVIMLVATRVRSCSFAETHGSACPCTCRHTCRTHTPSTLNLQPSQLHISCVAFAATSRIARIARIARYCMGQYCMDGTYWYGLGEPAHVAAPGPTDRPRSHTHVDTPHASPSTSLYVPPRPSTPTSLH